MAIAHQLKYLNNQFNHPYINSHLEYNCWNLHPHLNPKKHKKDANKKNMLSMCLISCVEINSDVDENIICTS